MSCMTHDDSALTCIRFKTKSDHFTSPLSVPQTSIDILTTVVRNTKPPLSEMLVCQAFPVVAQCTLRTDDNTIMQVNQSSCFVFFL